MKGEKKLHYPSLNGLRAISVLLVVFLHLRINNNVLSEINGDAWYAPIITFLQDGHLGVNVFFIISGFLITSLLIDEEKRNHTISLKKFYIRRTLRIFPAYYFLLAVYFVFHSLEIINIEPGAWATAVTYTKYFNWKQDWFTAHAWSLSIEEHFYLVWPFLFMLGNYFRKTVVVGIIFLVPCIRAYLFFYPIEWIDELSIFTRIDAIATGCLFALFSSYLRSFFSSFWRISFFVSATGLVCLPYLHSFAKSVQLDFWFVPFGITHGTVANFFISVILMYSVFGPKRGWFMLLNTKLLNYIGVLSYSIYLWQQLFISKLGYWCTEFPQNLFFILMMALVSYYLIEKPFLRLKSKFN